MDKGYSFKVLVITVIVSAGAAWLAAKPSAEQAHQIESYDRTHAIAARHEGLPTRDQQGQHEPEHAQRGESNAYPYRIARG